MDKDSHKERLQISASLLAADPLNLRDEVIAVERAGVNRLHIDIMDGHYVPNMTFGPHIIKSLKRHTKLPFEVHLMVEQVDHFLDMFMAVSDCMIVHPETTRHLHRTLSYMKDRQVRCGIALNPGTPLSYLEPIMNQVDYILLMSVDPGFGGQEFIIDTLDRIETVHKMFIRYGRRKDINIAVDGGVNIKNATSIVEKGADILVAGSSIFQSSNYEKAIHSLKLLPSAS